MGTEIERRWLVEPGRLPQGLLSRRDAKEIEQVYLPQTDGRTVLRLRRATTVGSGHATHYLTTKVALTGMTNAEDEVEISEPTFRALKEFAVKGLTKVRYILPLDNAGDGLHPLRIELDQFDDGLWIAEIEIPREDFSLSIPDWFGAEVTGDRSLSNFAMAKPLKRVTA